MFKTNAIMGLMVAAVLAFGSAAKAVVIFGFDVNTVQSASLFNYSTNGTASVSDDTLTANTKVDLSVSVDGGSPTVFTGADLVVNAAVASVTRDPMTNKFYFALTGTFSFSQGGTEIVSGSIDGSNLLVQTTPISATKFKVTSGDSVFNFALNGEIYTSTGPLLAALLGSNTLGGFQSMHFTAERARGASSIVLTNSGGVTTTTTDFSITGSYSGDSELLPVPEPATVGLVGLGALVMAGSRRRSA
ncbi:MAG: PEP-CTERM sorting domain-containing protein [Planctomycetes bacterium]|nr:PEP-CTERM sorting domain-containing protein [Planctomycetota bacterium]